MITEERYENILTLVKKYNRISYSELAKTLYVSESTIRRDVNSMADKGLLMKIHTGASVFESKTQESSTYIRETKMPKEKKYICSLAAKLINDNSTIFLDASTTSAQLINYLNGFNNLTIVTNGIDTCLRLMVKTNFEVLLAGGQVISKTHSTSGMDAINYINNIYCDYVFFSCKGLANDGRITEANVDTKNIKYSMIKNSKTKVLILDNSKFNKSFMLTTCNLKDIDYIITDQKPSQEFEELCKKSNVKLLY